MKCNLCFTAIILSIISLPMLLFFLIIGTIVFILGKIMRCREATEYGFNILIACDQMANTLALGDPDEVISSRAGKVQKKSKWAKCLCWFLNKLDMNHCKESIEEDEGKDQI